LTLIPLLLLAACGDGGAAEQAAREKAAAAEATKNLQLSAGQWETTTEVTRLTQMDKAPKPAINTPVGSKSTAMVCLDASQTKKPPAALLSGSDLYTCTTDSMYLSGGNLNASLACTRKGVSGRVGLTVNGSFTADSIEAEQSLSTSLPGEGDVDIVAKLTARRTGDCTAEPAKAG
jgi:hypothetical protein